MKKESITDLSIIILAAGSGTRMGTEIPKQFLEIRGKKVIEYTIANCEEISDDIIIVTSPEYIQNLKNDFPNKTIVEGGKTRFESVKNGLLAAKNPYVVVHDAVRPFVDEKILTNLYLTAKEFEGVGTYMPLVDSIVQIDEEGLLQNTPNRLSYVSSQTPQAFQKNYLLQALEQSEKHNTELLELIRLTGGKVKFIPGSPNFFKITYKPDIYTAEGYLNEAEGRVAIVTGGTSGIGLEVVKRLKDAGIITYVVSRSNKADIQMDVKKPIDVKKVFKQVYDENGRIDILVNNAGIASKARIEDISTEDWEDIISTNLSGAFFCTREALKYMRSGGVIINVASSGIDFGREGEGAYGSSKASLEYLSKVTALENKEKGISVFTVCPTRTKTNLRANLYPNEDPNDLPDPDEPAKIITLCCTHDLSLLTGQTFWLRRKM